MGGNIYDDEMLERFPAMGTLDGWSEYKHHWGKWCVCVWFGVAGKCDFRSTVLAP